MHKPSAIALMLPGSRASNVLAMYPDALAAATLILRKFSYASLLRSCNGFGISRVGIGGEPGMFKQVLTSFKLL